MARVETVADGALLSDRDGEDRDGEDRYVRAPARRCRDQARPARDTDSGRRTR